VVRHIFQACQAWIYTRVTSQASYSPEYITPTQKDHDVPHITTAWRHSQYQSF
jgi:hypothetical protein